MDEVAGIVDEDATLEDGQDEDGVGEKDDEEGDRRTVVVEVMVVVEDVVVVMSLYCFSLDVYFRSSGYKPRGRGRRC